MKIIKSLALTVVCIILGVVLAMQYKGIEETDKIKNEEFVRIEDVQSQLISESRKNDELRLTNEELKTQIQMFQNASGSENEKIRLIEEELNKLKLFSGLVDVSGSGIEITIDRGKHEYSSIRDTDLLKLVNELKASGAQALSVNEERITAITEIREAGNYMVINGIQVSEPYVIRAISDKDKLEASVKMAGGIVEELSLYMNVSVEKKDELIIKGLSNDNTLFQTDLLKRVNE